MSGWPLPPLPDSQLELLHWIRAHPGQRPQDAAAALGAAPNTVSTLIKHLLEAGLLDRRPDPTDGRAIRLVLTELAVERMVQWRDQRVRVLSDALARLEPDQQRAIEASLPALARVIQLLEGE